MIKEATSQTAWAVVRGESILVNTIFSTRIGAIRKWLDTEKILSEWSASNQAEIF